MSMLAKKHHGSPDKQGFYVDLIASEDEGSDPQHQSLPNYYLTRTKNTQPQDVLQMKASLADRFAVVSDDAYGGFVWILSPQAPAHSSASHGHRLNGSIVATIDYLDGRI